MKLPWVILSLIGLLAFSVMLTTITYLAKRGIPIPLILLVLSTVFGIVYFAQTYAQKGFSVPITLSTIFLLTLIGICGIIGNWAQFTAMIQAPNPGLALAIISAQSGLMVIFSWMLFKSHITPLQIVGLLFSIVSVALISIGTKSQ